MLKYAQVTNLWSYVDKSSKHYISLEVLWFVSFVLFIAILYAKLSVPFMKSGIVGLIMGSMILWLWSSVVFIVIFYAKLGVPPYEKNIVGHVAMILNTSLSCVILHWQNKQQFHITRSSMIVSLVVFIVLEERMVVHAPLLVRALFWTIGLVAPMFAPDGIPRATVLEGPMRSDSR